MNTPSFAALGTASRRALRFLTLLTLALLLATSLTACGDEEADDGCPSAGKSVTGIQGVVMATSCEAPFSSATVTARSGSGMVITTTTEADGTFRFDPSEIPEEGRWQISAEKGPFQGTTVETTTYSGGSSAYVVIKLGT